jgi:hypothetical protein
LWPIQVLLLFYHLCLAGSVFFLVFFGGRPLPLGFGVTSTDAAWALCAAAADAAVADAIRVSFFLGRLLLINRPILLLIIYYINIISIYY